jgi:hypothetical protein
MNVLAGGSAPKLLLIFMLSSALALTSSLQRASDGGTAPV